MWFFNPKNVTIGSSVDQNKESLSFWPIGQKLPFFNGKFSLAIKKSKFSCKMSFFWPMGQNYIWYQSSAVKNHLLKNKHNFLSKRRILVKNWFKINLDVDTDKWSSLESMVISAQFSLILFVQFFNNSPFSLTEEADLKKKKVTITTYLYVFLPYSLMIQRHLSYNIYILHHVSMYYIWRKIHWNDNQLLEMFYLNTIEQLFPFIEH